MRNSVPLLVFLLAATLCATVACANLGEEESLQERARRIHAAALTLDTHKDIHPDLALDRTTDSPEAERKWRARADPTFDGDNQVDFPKMRRGGYDCAFYIVYVGQGPLSGGGFVKAKREAMLKFKAIHRMADKYPEQIGLATTPDQVREFHAAGKLIACIGIENGYPMGENLSLIAEFHRLGARYMSIAHTGHNQLGDAHTPAKPLHGGLSPLGREAVAELNRVGIMVDVSHASKLTMMQVIGLSQAPVIASHSGCAAVREHTRNLDDEQLRALKQNGGVLQCVALGSFIKDDTERKEATERIRKEMGIPGWKALYQMREEGVPDEMQAKLDRYEARIAAEVDPKFPVAGVTDFVDHIDHAVKVMGIRHVGISSDFDGGGGIQGWDNAGETFQVTLELVRRGYSEADIQALWSGNTLRLWTEVEAVAKRLQASGK